MPKLKITITGEKVHNVAYRPFLLSVAEGFEINRFFAENVTRDGTEVVEALIEGDADKIERFKEHVSKNFPENASVDDVATSDYDGPVMNVESFSRYLTASQLSKIGTYGGQMLGKQDQALGKMDQMLGKQDETINEIKLVREDLKTTMEHGFSGLKEEHIKTREMSMEIFHSEVQGLRQEINSLRSSVEEIRKKVGIA